MANRIHPTAIIGPDVEMGEDNVIGPFTVLQGPVRIGHGNFIATHASIGGAAEVHGHIYEPSWEETSQEGGVVIGDNNIIKEFVTVNTGWQESTVIGNGCMLMGKVHLGHDVHMGNDVTVSCAALLGGHAVINDLATIGLGAALHQRVVVGAGAMVGMQAAVTREVPPFVITMGAPAKPTRLNAYRLTKLGLDEDQQELLRAIIFDRSGSVAELPDSVRTQVSEWLERQN